MTRDPQQLLDLAEHERLHWGVPGMALAVVADGAPLLVAGLGTTGDGAAVGPATAFAWASDTKAFTGALAATLEAEGLLDLDAPVRDVLPWFALQDPHATALATTTDLLAHRTGLPRHDLVWAGDRSLTLEGCARALAHLEPVAGFRDRFLYSNLCVNAAGHVMESAAGAPYAALLQDRLLGPAGMTGAGLGFDGRTETALPHAHDGTVRAPRAADRLGPSGGLVASAADLARWLLARLGVPLDGRTVLPAEVLARLHTPVTLGSTTSLRLPGRRPLGYALGCQQEDYRGHLLVSHGGSDSGWTSAVTLAPEAGVGVAVAGNLDLSPLPQVLVPLLLDALLDLPPQDWRARYENALAPLRDALAAATTGTAAQPTTPPGPPWTRPLADAVGRYEHPAYGVLEVRERDGALAATFHDFGDRLAVAVDRTDGFTVVLDDLVRVPVDLVGDSGPAVALLLHAEPSVAPIELRRA